MDLLGPEQRLAAGSGELPQVVPQLDSLLCPFGDLLLVDVLLGRQPVGQLADQAIPLLPGAGEETVKGLDQPLHVGGLLAVVLASRHHRLAVYPLRNLLYLADELNESLLVEKAPVKAGQFLPEPLELPAQFGHPFLQVPAVEVAALHHPLAGNPHLVHLLAGLLLHRQVVHLLEVDLDAVLVICDGGFESGEPGLHAHEINRDLAKTTTPESDAADIDDAEEEEADVLK